MTHRAFCEATGHAEDILSQVFSKRKHLVIKTLEASLCRIGYSPQIAPTAE